MKIGIIGGSGLYEMDGLDRRPRGDRRDALRRALGRDRRTGGSGRPSSSSCRATAAAIACCRRSCRFAPTSGRSSISASSASSRSGRSAACARRSRPGHLVVPDQFIDRTLQPRRHVLRERHRRPRRVRRSGLPGVVAGASSTARGRLGATVHAGGTYVCMEGPQFSTRAESELYRSWGAVDHRHDQPAGGEARARGRALLRDARARDRLRLLEAGRARGRDRGRAGGDARTTSRWRSRSCTTSCRRCRRRRGAAAAARSSTASSPTARKIPARVKRDLAPIIGRYVPEEE